MTQTVLFVCLHGAAKSRVAAALFNQAPPQGWDATSAGLEPDLHLSPTAARMLFGTPAAARLDSAPPRSVDSVQGTHRVVGIDCAPTGATDRWELHHREFDPAMREEIRGLVESLTRELREDVGAT